MSVSLALFVMFGLFLIGYLLGQRQGLKHGYKLGQAAIPLMLRERSLELGYCVLCRQGDGQQFLRSAGDIVLK
ncbi:hypothetical protein SAMN05660235_01983 [Sporolituus thermophilus DSM 23256]|uniref:Uncharacterized protein n=1 Tax=Sporolituus thermophilus DSM 23256 TaxID=1123285 RepID=A0A1G7M2S4_9FIRM|nr:hypothetical protein SAMN05660235_01983 [Sporolituus thermophilus DSM 23256]